MVSALDQAKRALVALLRALALTYNLTVRVTRDSSNKDITIAYRSVSRRVHPDRVGGNSGDQQRLNDAYGSWQDLLRKAPGSGKFSNGGSQESPSTLAVAKGRAKGYEIRSEGVLLHFARGGFLRAQMLSHCRAAWACQKFEKWMHFACVSEFRTCIVVVV